MEVCVLLASWTKEEQAFALPLLVVRCYVLGNLGRNSYSAAEGHQGSAYECGFLYEGSGLGAHAGSDFGISALQIVVIMSLIYILCFKYHEVTIGVLSLG